MTDPKWSELRSTYGNGTRVSDLRYLFLSLAALNGHYSLALAIEELDSEIECPNCGTVFDWTSQMS